MNVGNEPNYATEVTKPTFWMGLTYKLNSARYLIGPWFWAGTALYTLYLFTKFVAAVENSHLLIGLVE